LDAYRELHITDILFSWRVGKEDRHSVIGIFEILHIYQCERIAIQTIAVTIQLIHMFIIEHNPAKGRMNEKLGYF